MPLPQQVVEQLGREPTGTPGWSSGIILFSGAIFVIVVGLYLGLAFGYEPYLNAQIAQAQSQMGKVGQSISSSDQSELIAYYSEVANLHTLISGHVLFSQFLTWLGSNTEANVYYNNMSFTSGNQVTLTALGAGQADVDEQLEIFEASPEVQAVSVGTVAFSPTAGAWMFNVTLTMQPSVFAWQAASANANPPLPASASNLGATNVATTTP